jgi:hypothetical protein
MRVGLSGHMGTSANRCLKPVEQTWSKRSVCLHEPTRSIIRAILREQVCLKNVTPKTRVCYETASRAFQTARATTLQGATRRSLITRADLIEFVVHLVSAGETRVLQQPVAGAERFLPVAA